MTQLRDMNQRKLAKENGEITFSTGLPCKNGHITYRYTSTGACSACKKITDQRWRRKNRTGRWVPWSEVELRALAGPRQKHMHYPSKPELHRRTSKAIYTMRCKLLKQEEQRS